MVPRLPYFAFTFTKLTHLNIHIRIYLDWRHNFGGSAGVFGLAQVVEFL